MAGKSREKPRRRPTPVLVTGGAGYIGSHFVRELVDRGSQPVVLDDFSTGSLFGLPTSVPVIVGDCADRELVKRVMREYGIRDVVHFAAKLIVPDSFIIPLEYYLSNTVKLHTLLETCISAGAARFVFSSTAAVYGDPTSTPVAEDASSAPISPYGASKLAAESIVRDACVAHGLGFAILRYFNVASADPNGFAGPTASNPTHLVRVAVQAALGLRDHIDVYGTDYETTDGTCIRDYIHVTDLAAAHVAALARLEVAGGGLVLNCGYGHGYSVLQVIDAVRRLSGVDFPVIRGPRRPGDPKALVADVTRIRAALDWIPRYDDLDTIVRHSLNWEMRRKATAPTPSAMRISHSSSHPPAESVPGA